MPLKVCSAQLASGPITVVVGISSEIGSHSRSGMRSTAVAASAWEFHCGIKRRAPFMMNGALGDSQSHVTDVDPG